MFKKTLLIATLLSFAGTPLIANKKQSQTNQLWERAKPAAIVAGTLAVSTLAIWYYLSYNENLTLTDIYPLTPECAESLTEAFEKIPGNLRIEVLKNNPVFMATIAIDRGWEELVKPSSIPNLLKVLISGFCGASLTIGICKEKILQLILGNTKKETDNKL